MKPCRKCSKRHNTLLHLEDISSSKTEAAPEDTGNVDREKIGSTSLSHVSYSQNKQVLLATAIVNISNDRGKIVACRALLDSGSQSCFITRDCVKKLALKMHKINIPVCGLGEIATQTHSKVRITLQSRINKFKTELDCLVLDRITQALPTDRIHRNKVHRFQKI